METLPTLKDPWLVAVWPGMGHVALSAGYYLMAKLNMHAFAEVSADDLFEAHHVDVQNGLIRLGHTPRNRLFIWKDPNNRHDLVVFIGEAQPPKGTRSFCARLVLLAEELGISRIFTFAAMATQMHPTHASRVFAAAIDQESLQELNDNHVTTLDDGQIGGLNGVLLGVAHQHNFQGACLLGEMPHLFSQLPYPKASLAVLKVFLSVAGISLDLQELREQAEAVDEQLGSLLARIEDHLEKTGAEFAEESSYTGATSDDFDLDADDEAHIEHLFSLSAEDRTKAYELKRELDRLGVFEQYEDRFLDLFSESGP